MLFPRESFGPLLSAVFSIGCNRLYLVYVFYFCFESRLPALFLNELLQNLLQWGVQDQKGKWLTFLWRRCLFPSGCYCFPPLRVTSAVSTHRPPPAPCRGRGLSYIPEHTGPFAAGRKGTDLSEERGDGSRATWKPVVLIPSLWLVVDVGHHATGNALTGRGQLEGREKQFPWCLL